MVWIGCTRLAQNMVNAVHLIVPGATMPAIGPDEVENSPAHDVEGNVETRIFAVQEV